MDTSKEERSVLCRLHWAIGHMEAGEMNWAWWWLGSAVSLANFALRPDLVEACMDVQFFVFLASQEAHRVAA